ncbi:MAG: hypothetical protein RLN89_06860 [Parvibaculum sp.]
MYVLIFALILGLVPAAIAQSKGRSFFLWWIYGAAIWIVAFPHALIMKADQQGLEAQGLQNGQKKCPFCAELVRQEASVCKHCGRDLADHQPDSSGDLQPVANASVDVSSNNQMNAAPPSALGDNTERVVLGVAAAFLLFIFVIILVALNPTSPERRVVGRTVGNMAQTGSATTSPEATLPMAPPRASERTASQAGAVSECSVINRHGFIAFLVCPSDATPAEWRQEGIKACGSLSICKAWIWDDRRHAATSLPMTDTQIDAAVAVLSNSPQELAARSGPALSMATTHTSEQSASQAGVVSSCSVIDRQAFVVFVVCDPDMSETRWRLEGIKACGARRVCNAWIWESRRNAATSLPMTDEQVNAAVAVWNNAPQTLMNCRTTGC